MAAADALRSKVTANAAAIALVASSAATRRYGFCLQKRSRRYTHCAALIAAAILASSTGRICGSQSS
jgi:hypothetical protein